MYDDSFKVALLHWEIIHFQYRLTIKSIEGIVQFWQWHDLEPILCALFNCKLSPFLFAREFPISEIHYWSSQPFSRMQKWALFLDGHMNEVRPQNASVRSTALGRSLICLCKHLFFRDNEHAATNAAGINCKVWSKKVRSEFEFMSRTRV